MLSSLNLSPKFHGAYLGAGAAAAVANVITGLIQSYGTHALLPASAVQGIYAVVEVVLAGFGAYIMPSGRQPAAPAPGAAGPGGAAS